MVALIALPQLAGVVLSGTNGRILFTSGRDVTDAQAKLRFARDPAGGLRHLHPGPRGAARHSPLNITNSPGFPDDRPAWSPDGTRIAWQSTGDIAVRAVAGGPVLGLTEDSATFEDKPAWTPDSRTPSTRRAIRT